MFASDFSNPWVAAVDGARRKLPALAILVAALALAVGVIKLGQILFGVITGASPDLLEKPVLLDGLFVLIVFGALIVVAIIGALIEGRRIFVVEPRPYLAAPFGLFLGGGGLFMAAGLAAAAGVVAVGYGAPTGSAALHPVLISLMIYFFQTFAEELYFRGWLQPILCSRWGPRIGVGVAAIAFACMHFMAGPMSPLAFFNLCLAGFFFGLLALRTGGLIAPWAAHAAYNWLEVSVLGLSPNPGIDPKGSLIDLELAGSGIWTGGAHELNGSFALTITMLALNLLLLALAPRRVSPSVRP